MEAWVGIVYFAEITPAIPVFIYPNKTNNIDIYSFMVCINIGFYVKFIVFMEKYNAIKEY